jgi:hypothetical protein
MDRKKLAGDVFAHYLCDDCRRRNAESEVEYQAERAEKKEAAFVSAFARLAPLCRDWLRQAPQLAELPDPVGTFPPEPPRHGFVEVFDEATATQLVVLAFLYGAPLVCSSDVVFSHVPDGQFFRIDYPDNERRPPGFEPFQPPSMFENVLVRSQSLGYDDFRLWKGSICRLVDGRIVLHWRPETWVQPWSF